MGSAAEFSAFGCHILSIRRSSLGSPKFDPCLGLIFGVVLDFQKRQRAGILNGQSMWLSIPRHLTLGPLGVRCKKAMCRSAGPPPPSGRALRGMKGR